MYNYYLTTLEVNYKGERKGVSPQSFGVMHQFGSSDSPLFIFKSYFLWLLKKTAIQLLRQVIVPSFTASLFHKSPKSTNTILLLTIPIR